MLVASRTHRGLSPMRQLNEDSLYAPQGAPEGLLLVADGMGGHKAGEVASAIAMQTVVDEMRRMRALPEPPAVQDMVKEAVKLANRAVLRHSASDEKFAGMGTTLTMAVREHGNDWVIGHVGDSRAYYLGGFGIKRLTRDHTLVEELLRLGEITPEEAVRHPQRHVITRTVGTGTYVRVDCTKVTLAAGEGVLLCSDGLTEHVFDEEIARVFRYKKSPEECVEALLELCLNRGGRDNVSIVLGVNEEKE